MLCDRFLDSTLVYQGIGKGLGMAYIRQLHQMTLGNFAPQHNADTGHRSGSGLARAGKRSGNETRFENMHRDFHEQVRAGFLALAKAEPWRCAVIDASGKPEEVHKAIGYGA